MLNTHIFITSLDDDGVLIYQLYLNVFVFNVYYQLLI